MRAAGQNVEQELEAIRTEAIHQQFLGRQLEAVRYYLAALIEDAEERCLRSLPDHVTNYIDLLEDIEDWRVRSQERERICLVTFNYDTLLDRACRTVLGVRLDSLGAYLGEGNYILLKLHGSLNWREEVDHPDKDLRGSAVGEANQLIDLAGRYQRTGRYAMPGQDLNGWEALRPAIAVPTVTKTGEDFACPRDHVKTLDEVVPHVSHLVVVGWRGVEGHFHERWRRAASRKTVLQKVLIVGATDSGTEQVEERLKRELGVGGGVIWERVSGGFSTFVQASAVKTFLSTN